MAFDYIWMIFDKCLLGKFVAVNVWQPLPILAFAKSSSEKSDKRNIHS